MIIRKIISYKIIEKIAFQITPAPPVNILDRVKSLVVKVILFNNSQRAFLARDRKAPDIPYYELCSFVKSFERIAFNVGCRK